MNHVDPNQSLSESRTLKRFFGSAFQKNGQSALIYLLIVALLIGIYCRFVNLDRKLYWHDETFTSMRISGYHEAEVVQNLRAAGVVDIAYIQNFQERHPERGVGDTIKALIADGPQHPPLYYGMAHLWTDVFGSSITSVRTLPVVISLFAIPAIYWLAWELFQTHIAGTIAAILFTVSPFHVLYAQESRQYSLWTLIILLAGVALVKAMRSPTAPNWLCYALSLSALLYTTTLSLFLIPCHGIYALISERFRLSKTFIKFLISVALGLIGFSPWFYVLIHNYFQVSDTLNFGGEKWSISYVEIFKSLLRQPGRLFFDLNLNPGDPIGYFIPQWFFTPAALLLTLYAFYYLIQTTTRQTWLFPVSLTGGYGLLLVLQDLFVKGQGGGAASMPRYLIPCYLGIQLAIAYLFSRLLFANGSSRKFQHLWQVIFAIFLSASVISSLMTTQARVWWTKGVVGLNAAYPTAEYINRAANPLLISDGVSWDLLMMSHLLRPDVKVLSMPTCYVCQLPPEKNFKPNVAQLSKEYSDLFVFPESSRELIQEIESQSYVVEKVPIAEPVAANIVLQRVVKLNLKTEQPNI